MPNSARPPRLNKDEWGFEENYVGAKFVKRKTMAKNSFATQHIRGCGVSARSHFSDHVPVGVVHGTCVSETYEVVLEEGCMPHFTSIRDRRRNLIRATSCGEVPRKR